ncbi:Cytochrome oxidase maturation protein cbb3-type [Botrimarina colliarenosi]|uniref:Cytochrome oxidase maturation protein cbb3-type n=1 Tax=Botrimarina colliarenosi TaxID=2528001 RepID=A0A5C6AC21_9BACT|nr:cbb3-type cytochrome oxidase assembly protein CcoS [Botrimarina colliarenosi]TWT97564.1 Cytochrome oxidase maturation protein cbb3-type [Botrimarina colliarenosi]
MSVVFVMAPVALLLAATAVAAFIWATRDGQFDDTETPAHRMLFDEVDKQGQPPKP